jgi:uncharacterized repeat protein (TIGR01451 family)
LTFTFGTLGVGQVHTLQTTFKSKRPGPVKSIALMRTHEGFTDQKEVNTLITQPQLKVDILAPKTGVIGMPLNYTIRLSNPGTGDLDDVLVQADFDVGLEHSSVNNPTGDPKLNRLQITGRSLKANSQSDEFLTLTPTKAGNLALRVRVSGGGLDAQAAAFVNVTKPNVSLRVVGPNKAFAGRPVDWRIFVRNDGDVEQTGVIVRDRLPAELGFKEASRGGTFSNGDVVWNLGTLKPREEVVLDLKTDALRIGAAEKITMLTGDGGLSVQQTSRIQIEGAAALRMELTDLSDPVEVGKNAVYRMTLTNTGSAPANKIDVKATAPELLKIVNVTAPAKETILGQIVTFGQFDLPAGAKATFTFEYQALKTGKAIFRVEYKSELNVTPIFEEEPTTLVAPLQNPVPMPPGKN